jgi:hypothetical protein
MAAKRLIYATASRATAYVWSHGHLSVDTSFPASEDGIAAFTNYVSAVPRSLFYVLADVVEEDFHWESVPFIRGKDRRALLDRKLAQRYRDASLSTAISLGVDRGQRTEERIVFSSFTNTQQLHPWLTVLRDADVPVVGVYSAALIAPHLTAQLGLKKVPSLVVALSQAGLRQSYVERGQIRFSRLGPLEAAEVASPERTAEAFERETTRVYQYLTAMRVLPREGGTIDAVLIAPPGQADAVRDAAPSIGQLRLQVLELDGVRRKIGLRSAPADAGAEAIYLHLLASHPPKYQYAKENLRIGYRVHQSRVGLVAGGATLLAFCLLYAGSQAWEMLGLREAIAQDRAQAAISQQAYSRVTGRFPPMPTSTDNLRVVMDQYRLLAAQTRYPQGLLAEISQVLNNSPRIEIERLDWEYDGKVPEVAKEGGPAIAAQPSGKPPRYEIVEVTARVQSTRASDYRGIQLLVNQFVEDLHKRPGVEVLARKLPFELTSGTQLSGDIGTERASSMPEFTVTVARRIGQ